MNPDPRQTIDAVLNVVAATVPGADQAVALQHLPYDHRAYWCVHRPKYRQVLRRLHNYLPLPFAGGPTIADLGAGSGMFSRVLVSLGARIIAVDGSERFSANHAAAGVEFRRCWFEHEPLPLPDASCDAVMCMEVIEHLAEAVAFPLREMHRVVKPGGYCVVTVPNAFDLQILLRWLWRDNYYPRLDEFFTPVREPDGTRWFDRHVRLYTMPELTGLLCDAGFVIREQRYLMPGLYPATPLRKVFAPGLQLAYVVGIPWRSLLCCVAQRPAAGGTTGNTGPA